MLLFEEGELDIITDLPGDYIPTFLDKHIMEFENNPPKYVLVPEKDNQNIYNLIKSDVNGFYSNSQKYIDLSIIYLQDPKPVK